MESQLRLAEVAWFVERQCTVCGKLGIAPGV
jgi:hypothetical protein